MATQEEIIRKQADQIEAFKKAISMLESRIRRLEQNERSIKANITTNARDIRNVGVSVQNVEAKLRG
jgi:predicted  nucleic acid-binding Zn-ribbon protein